jgi:hypothetical protein
MLGKNMWRAFLASLVLTLPCMAGSFPDYPVHPVSDYPISTVKAGLMIAAIPLDAIKEQQTYFSTKLTPKGYLPVFIVMQNASTEDSFLVKRDAITYRLLGATGSVASTPKTPSKAGETIAVAEAITTTVVPTADVVTLSAESRVGDLRFGHTSYFSRYGAVPMYELVDLAIIKLVSNATEVQQNLFKKALQSKTLSPGASAHGFLYVQVPKGSARQTIHLRVLVTRPGSDDPLGFDLMF